MDSIIENLGNDLLSNFAVWFELIRIIRAGSDVKALLSGVALEIYADWCELDKSSSASLAKLYWLPTPNTVTFRWKYENNKNKSVPGR